MDGTVTVLYHTLMRSHPSSFIANATLCIKNDVLPFHGLLMISGLIHKLSDVHKLDDEVPVLLIEVGTTLEETAKVCAICDGVRYVTPEIPEIMKINIDGQFTPTAEQFLSNQSADPYFRSLSATVWTPRSVQSYDRNVYQVRTASLDGSLQNVVPVWLRGLILHLSHYLVLSGHPSERRMYDTTRQEY